MRERESCVYKLNVAPSLNLSFADLHLSKVNCSPATEETKIGEKGSANGLSSSQVSLSRGVAKHGDEIENHKADEKLVNYMNVEGNRELLSEAFMEVPIVIETYSMNSLCLQYEEGSVDIGEPPKETQGTTVGKQQGRKPSKYNRKGRRRKPSKYNRKAKVGK